MIKLPADFIATKYPGYFFNAFEDRLYSMKVDGVLKPIQFIRPNYFNKLHRTEGGYRISVKGVRKFLSIESLRKLKDHNATIPVKFNR